jgi:acetylornithine/succinyldiaminopimelate/putrescine aminotransferase
MAENENEKQFLQELGGGIVQKVKNNFLSYSGLFISPEREKLLDSELQIMICDYFEALDKSYEITKNTYKNGNTNKKRSRFFNKVINARVEKFKDSIPVSAEIFVLGGLMFDKHLGGIKYLTGLTEDNGAIIDVFCSATSLSLGAGNPYFSIFDSIENALNIRDNICSVYHAGIKQAFFVNEICKLYPNDKKVRLCVHCESSGTVVDNIAIECAIAYMEKRTGKTNVKILCIGGTWAGGYGTAREASGFGADNFITKRTGKNLFAEKVLPLPTKENHEKFIEILQNKIKTEQVAGIYIEPDCIGDAGIINFDKDLLQEIVNIMSKNKLPIIADCVQQLGRSGGYFGENVETILKNYSYLILTTAKSVSNGTPLGYVIMPKEIADCAYPVSHLTTNQFGGSLLRTIAVAQMLKNKKFQSWLEKKSNNMEKLAKKYNLELRGKFLNRSIYVGSNDNVKLIQIALFIEDGILVGALPNSLRYQPMLMEYTKTNDLIAEIIFRRINEVKAGKISKDVMTIYNKLSGVSSGLARD